MPHGDETGRGDTQVYGGRGSGGAGGSGYVDEVGQIWGSKVVEGLKGKQEDSEFEMEMMSWMDRVRVIMRAAEFWTSWSLWRDL